MKTPKAKLQGLARQREIGKALIEADLVDCMVALHEQTSTIIPAASNP